MRAEFELFSVYNNDWFPDPRLMRDTYLCLNTTLLKLALVYRVVARSDSKNVAVIFTFA